MQLNAKARLSIEVSPEANASGNSGVTFLEGSKTLVIPPNIAIEFEISRQSLASSQEATFRIKNLGEISSGLLQKDPYVMNEYRAIQFRAGYNGALPLAFNGFVRSATSYRQGQDFITEVSAYDGGLAMSNGFTSQSLAAGYSARDVIVMLARSLPKLGGDPIVGSFSTTSKRGRALFGNTWQLILAESNGVALIDNGQVKALGLDEALGIPVPLINSKELIGTPRRTPTSLDFEVLFRPELTLGQLVQLESRTLKYYNGVYKIAGLTHRGLISETSGGVRRTTIKVFLGVGEFQTVQGAPVQ